MPQPFSYYGGKQRIVKKIIPYIPLHTVFCEPYCGGASLYWNKPDLRIGNEQHYREILNDTNSLIYNFFTVLRDRGPELTHMIEHSLYSEEHYRKSKSYEGDDPLLKAYYFFVNINQSFACKYNNGWGRGVFCNNHTEIYKNKCDNIKLFIDRLKSTYISHCDGLKCIKDWDSPQTFFYCDPPYPNTDQGHYKGFTQQDFENLIETLDNCKGSFILSCYQNEAVPKGWKKVEFKTRNSSSNTKKGGHRAKRTECIWIREAKEKPREEILKIYEKQKQLKLL